MPYLVLNGGQEIFYSVHNMNINTLFNKGIYLNMLYLLIKYCFQIKVQNLDAKIISQTNRVPVYVFLKVSHTIV